MSWEYKKIHTKKEKELPIMINAQSLLNMYKGLSEDDRVFVAQIRADIKGLIDAEKATYYEGD